MEGHAPPEWKRDTPWRQGHVLEPSTAAALGLSEPLDPGSTCVVVIGHDCDVANANLNAEPDVEVIVGRVVAAPHGNFSWGKAPRTLHLPMQRAGARVTVELVTTSKRLVPKAFLAAFSPDDSFLLEPKSLAVLRSWLSSRYNRAAFTDTFVERMKTTKVDTRLAKLLELHGGLISFVYFDIDQGRALERPKGEPYELSIALVFPPGDDLEESADAANAVAEAVGKACEERLFDKTTQRCDDIMLKSCFAISEDDLPVSKARVLMHWRFEHMSFKSEEEQPNPPVT